MTKSIFTDMGATFKIVISQLVGQPLHLPRLLKAQASNNHAQLLPSNPTPTSKTLHPIHLAHTRCN